MIPRAFDYAAPQTLHQALALLEDGDHKVLAGGMSLIPLMKLRLATPEKVVDISRVPDLNQVTESGGVVRIGALATHHEIEMLPLIRARCPLLAETASHIGDVQVRNMGTIGGSIVHADPAADYPAALVALEARIRIVSAHADRTVDATDFFLDAFTTDLGPGEIVLELHVPVQDGHEGYRYEKVAHPASGFAVIGVAARVQKNGGRMAMARIVVTGLGPRAFRGRKAEQLLEGGATVAEATAAIGEREPANQDLYASADYRRHLARVHAARALVTASLRAS